MCDFNFVIILTSLIYLDNFVGSLKFWPSLIFKYKYIYVLYIYMYYVWLYIQILIQCVAVNENSNALFSNAGLKMFWKPFKIDIFIKYYSGLWWKLFILLW